MTINGSYLHICGIRKERILDTDLFYSFTYAIPIEYLSKRMKQIEDDCIRGKIVWVHIGMAHDEISESELYYKIHRLVMDRLHKNEKLDLEKELGPSALTPLCHE